MSETRVAVALTAAALTAAAALAVLTACSAASTTTSPPAHPAQAQVVTDTCADLIVLGHRGQGQSARTHEGVGAEVQNTFRALLERLRGGERVRLEAIRYPAGETATRAEFDDDVATGRHMLVARHRALSSACPSSTVVLMGFSEGADVVHHAMGAMTAQDAANIVAVAALGDPLRDPDDDVTTETFGAAALTGRGSLAPGPRWGAAIRDRVVTFCTPKDNVCNAPMTGRRGGISDTHRTFYEQPSTARLTADRIARVIEASQ